MPDGIPSHQENPVNSAHYYKHKPGPAVGREVAKEPTMRAGTLRDLYLGSKSSVSMEFPYWYTRRWMELEGEIPIIRRAEALKSAFSHLTPVIFPRELLVMRRTCYLRGSYPMPWLSELFLLDKEDELYREALEAGQFSNDQVTKMGTGGGNVTKSSGNVVSIAGKFGMRREELPILMALVRKWEHQSVEDIGHKYEMLVPDYPQKESIMRSLICLFDSGFTLPQGREVINYYYPLRYGIDGIITWCKGKIAEVAGHPGMDRLYFYQASCIALEGIKKWILNYAQEARELAEKERDEELRREYTEIAETLTWISSHPPRSFREALQLCWTFHIAVLNEDCISGLSPGRLGQVLYPWWKQDMDNGTITRESTIELLECMRLKFTELDCFASTGVIGGVLSSNTFNNLCLGGLDKNGANAENELEMLILESAMTCSTPQPTLTLLYDEKLPEEFLLKGIECTKTGTGYPAWVNNRVAMEFIQNNYGPEGMTPQEARAWAIGGCLETSAGNWMPLRLGAHTYYLPGGAGAATSVGVHFIGLPKLLEVMLFDGMDMRTGQRIFPPRKKPIETYDDLMDTFQDHFRKTVDILCRCNNIQHDAWRKITPPVINSVLKPDCLTKGKHIGEMGSRYNTTFNVEVSGGINLVNSLASIKKNIFEEKNFTLDDLRSVLLNNFGYHTAEETGSYSLSDQKKRPDASTYARVHTLCHDAPKYGNDDPYVDSILADWEDWFCTVCHEFVSLYEKPLYACQISVSTHGPMGAVTLAGPDGRLEGTAYADASLSAYPGTDRNGPYALCNSATCWDHAKSQNSQLNVKIHPSVIKGREGARKFLEFIRAYMRRGGFHIQFNVVDSKVLREAQIHPEHYRGLMVRVAGFTQYWVELGKPIQDEIIARTEYEEIP
ncbi:MAG: 4-hydroxyphenylacetate decarboxylase large subunit [Methanomicrobiales archaeon]